MKDRKRGIDDKTSNFLARTRTADLERATSFRQGVNAVCPRVRCAEERSGDGCRSSDAGRHGSSASRRTRRHAQVTGVDDRKKKRMNRGSAAFQQCFLINLYIRVDIFHCLPLDPTEDPSASSKAFSACPHHVNPHSLIAPLECARAVTDVAP